MMGWEAGQEQGGVRRSRVRSLNDGGADKAEFRLVHAASRWSAEGSFALGEYFRGASVLLATTGKILAKPRHVTDSL